MEISRKPKLKEPYLVATWPGMGEVALQAGEYLRKKLRALRFAVVEETEFFQPVGIEIKDGLIELPKSPRGNFYYWRNRIGNNDLLIFTGDAQPSPEKGREYANKIMDLAEELGVRKIFTFAAIPVPIDHLQTPHVLAAVTQRELLSEIPHHEVEIMTAGQISGLNGLFLGIAKERGLKGISLLGEIPLYAVQIENPKASLAVLEVFTRMLDIEIDTRDLEERCKYIEEEVGRLIDSMKSSLTPGPMSDEEIERLKKGLAVYTKLPVSAKKKIEKLFGEVARDVSKANILKEELDRWNVYKDYEDRFLDLFKKGKPR